jgi:hypothetical protein
MTSYEYLAVIAFLGALIAFLVISNYTERKNLLDRLMARDFTDLVKNEKARAEPEENKDYTVVNL